MRAEVSSLDAMKRLPVPPARLPKRAMLINGPTQLQGVSCHRGVDIPLLLGRAVLVEEFRPYKHLSCTVVAMILP